MAGIEERQLQDLSWLGIDWDQGPSSHSSPLGPFRQSQRDLFYAEAVRTLHDRGLVFPCSRTRRDLREVASAPHSAEESPYPTRLRPQQVPPGWLEDVLGAKNPSVSIRFQVPDRTVRFDDVLAGTIAENVSRTTGDFILRRRDGLWAYQLAVVVDDGAQGITEVVRGVDLLSSTARQILLQESLSLPRPRYLHVPLLLDAEGEKLSKRNGAVSLRELRAAGRSSAEVVGFLAKTLRLQDHLEPVTPRELVQRFDPALLPTTNVRVPDDLACRLR